MNGVNYEPVLRDMTWSFSRLKTYNQCPAQWYLRYLMEEPEEEQFYASFGSFCHELIARYYNGELKQDELLPEYLQGFCSRVQGDRPSREIEAKYLEQGARYFESFAPFPLNTELVEEPVNLNLDGLNFTGIIDYLGSTVSEDGTKSYIVVDHKSADIKPRSKRKTPTQSDKKLDDTLMQLYLYAEWVHTVYGVYPTELWLNCFRTGVLIREPFSEEKLADAKDWVKTQVGRIFREDLFLPSDDYYYCRWVCGQHRNCDLFLEEYNGRRSR